MLKFYANNKSQKVEGGLTKTWETVEHRRLV